MGAEARAIELSADDEAATGSKEGSAAPPRRYSKTEFQIIRYIQRHKDKPVSKAQIARALGRNEKTIDRLISRLRKDGLVVSEYRFDEKTGQQLASSYRYVGMKLVK